MLAAHPPLYAPRTHFHAARRSLLWAVFFSALAACGLLGGAAHAAEAAAAAPSLWEQAAPKLLNLALNPEVWIAVLGLVYLLAVRKSAHKAKVDQWIAVSFGVVQDLKARGLFPKGADPALLALSHLKELASADGTRLGPEALALAQAAWKAMNAEQKIKDKVASAVPTGSSVQTVSVPLSGGVGTGTSPAAVLPGPSLPAPGSPT